MCASSSSAMVSLPFLVLFSLSRAARSASTSRRRREKHHSHVAHQRILRAACMSPVPLARSNCLALTQRRRFHPTPHLLPQVQHVVPEVTIPPEVTPENVTTYIVDSGSEFLLSISSYRSDPFVFRLPVFHSPTKHTACTPLLSTIGQCPRAYILRLPRRRWRQ